jgi:hypothetical protein
MRKGRLFQPTPMPCALCVADKLPPGRAFLYGVIHTLSSTEFEMTPRVVIERSLCETHRSIFRDELVATGGAVKMITSAEGAG